MYQSYSLSRYIDGDTEHGTTFTVADDDAINCAHMLAAGFNTISRNMMGDFVLGVVDTKAGTVQYDGKIEQIKRAEPWSYEQTFKFEPSEGDADTILSLLDAGGKPTFMASGKMTVDEKSKCAHISRDEPEPSTFAHVARSVLEDAYDEYLLVREMLSEIGVETIPISAGVDELREQVAELTKRNNHEFHARSMYEQVEGQKREAARAELISFVKRSHAKKVRIQAAGEPRPELDDRWRGMLDVLAKFLVVIGEADADEGHAVARRLTEVDDVEP